LSNPPKPTETGDAQAYIQICLNASIKSLNRAHHVKFSNKKWCVHVKILTELNHSFMFSCSHKMPAYLMILDKRNMEFINKATNPSNLKSDARFLLKIP
jgi:hypothetical protein